MKILQNVVVKQILTEQSRQKLLDKYNDQMLQLQKEYEQLQFEAKRLEKSKRFQPGEIKPQFEKEMSIRREKEKLLEFQISQLHMLPLGSELKEKEVQAIIDVSVGDAWGDPASQPVIVIKDGIIQEIR
ncbi:YlqD family protein [Neobacillus sp. PS3-34]|uniref:YlqD family protein n=1 Tax=Neobacillus sp. PS3-34 TaxID=3070678 RepID=UPI0027DF1360|nr:YlqD family protein [Neobacillus sp. PS3-34]WML50513.1 YlqD family protein [Neobacillus sp. PS3-34]